jgi:hypothetical protein
MGKMVYVRAKKVSGDKNHWSSKAQLEAVTTYLALGNLMETGRVLNIPIATLNNWRRSPWWGELVTEIQSGEGQRSDNKMTKTIDKALDLIMDRMADGDFQYDQKTGRLVKVPLKARDLERVASGLFDKRQLIRKQPTQIKASDLGQAERLLALANQFSIMSGRHVEEKAVDQYIDGEYNVAIDEESK